MVKAATKKIRLFFLILIGFLSVSDGVLAASIETPTNAPPEIQLSQTFSFDTNITGLQAGEVYFVKCRLGQTSTTLSEGQTYNPITNIWLSDTSSWKDFPTVTASGNSISTSVQCRTKLDIPTGQKLIYASACLKKTDGLCNKSFKSSSGTTTNVVASPSSSPTPSPTPTPSDYTASSVSLFTISNTPSQINSDQSVSILVNLSLPDNPNTSFYLKGAFRHPDKPSNYFGLTQVSGEWVKNSSTYTNQYKITTGSSGNWSGNIEVKPDTEDSGFIGEGSYIFKVGRYKDLENSSATWSNEETIKITPIENSNQGTTLTKTGSDNSNSSPPPANKTSTSTVKAESSKKEDYQIASVAGKTTQASSPANPHPEVKSQKQINFPQTAGIFLLISGFSSLLYIYLRKKKL